MKHVPFGDSIVGVLEPGNNFAAWIDQFITPGRMYQKTWDPEGFFQHYSRHSHWDYWHVLWSSNFEANPNL